MTGPLTEGEIVGLVHTHFLEAKDALLYEKSVPLFPQATYDVPSYETVTFVRAIEARPALYPTPASQALREVIAERERQKTVEGWTPEHDDRHDGRELARAAGCYAMHAGNKGSWGQPDYVQSEPPFTDHDAGEYPWPWAIEWWKPSNPRRDLVKAAALILAEIERLDRAALQSLPAQSGEVA